MKELHMHMSHYLLLILIIGLGMFGIYYSTGNPGNQFIAVCLTSFFYFLWGTIHHYVDGDLHPKIVVEYLLISLLAVLLVRGAIFK